MARPSRPAPWLRATVVVAAALIVSGCAGDEPVPEPTAPVVTTTAEPEPVETPVPEPEPEPTGLTRPEAMDRNDDEGAIAAAEYYAQLAYEIARTGDPLPLAEMSDESCQFCQTAVRLVNEVWGEGGRYEGAEVVVSGPSSILGREELLGVIGVEVPVEVTEQRHLDSTGAEVATWEPWSGHLYVEVVHSYLGWVVMRVQVY